MILGSVLVGAACSSDSESDGSGGGDGGSGGEGNGAAGREDVLFDTVDPDSGVEGGTALGSKDKTDCVSEVARAETIPVDIYVMFDQSGSMINPVGDGTRLDAVRGAAVDFFNDQASIGLGVGLGYFGYLPLGETSCDPADYATPDVPIASLPDGAGSLIASLNGIEPTGETPTGAAVRGACSYAQTFKQENPTHYVVLLLVTDGIPEAPVTSRQYLLQNAPEPDAGADGGADASTGTVSFADAAGYCNPTLPDAVQATGDCATGETPIPTYVLGVGPELDNLNQIAVAGGTEQAYLVEGGDVAAQVLEAFTAIRGDALIPCEFQIPQPSDPEDQLDPETVNVRFIAGDEAQTETKLFNVVDAAGCSVDGATRDGWYYDDPAQPSRILLCESTCAMVKADTGGQVDYTLGCEQTRIIR